jgi:hypothetical protein
VIDLLLDALRSATDEVGPVVGGGEDLELVKTFAFKVSYSATPSQAVDISTER